MQELLLKRAALRDEQGTTRHYDYILLIDTVEAEGFCCESYGLKIREAESGHSCGVRHVTVSAARMEQLCRLVLKAGVTPVALKDVILDWL